MAKLKETDLYLINAYEEAIAKVPEVLEFLKNILDNGDLEIVESILKKFLEEANEKVNTIKRINKK